MTLDPLDCAREHMYADATSCRFGEELHCEILATRVLIPTDSCAADCAMPMENQRAHHQVSL